MANNLSMKADADAKVSTDSTNSKRILPEEDEKKAMAKDMLSKAKPPGNIELP